MSKYELTEQIKQEWEDSLNTDFLSQNNDLVKQLYSYFRTYDTCDENTKVQLVNDLVNSLAKEMNVNISKVVIIKDGSGQTAGSYNHIDKSVTINLFSHGDRFTFSAQILTTILHELRHACQAEHLMHLNNDFGRLVKYATENYTQPSTSNMMQEVGYVTNFTELDAQTFSFRAGKALTQEVVNSAQNENRFVRRVLEIKLRDINAQQKNFESSYGKYAQILDNSDNIIEGLKDHFIKSVIAFYNNTFETKRDEKQSADLLADSLEQFVKPKRNKTVITPSKDDILDIYVNVLSSIDPKDLAGKLDNSLTMLFEVMGFDFNYSRKLHVKKDDHLVYYNKYITKIRECVEFGKIFLDKFQIPYDKQNKSDIYEKYAEYATDYLVEVFKSNSNDEFDKMLAENIASLEIRDPKRFGRDILISKIMENIPTPQIKEILENSVTNDSNVVVRTFCLDRALLNGYAQKFLVEQNSGAFSQFLKEQKIQFSEGNFSDIYEKFTNTYPKYLAECLGKEELSNFDESLILYAFNFVENDSDEMKKYIEAIQNKYSKSQIKALFSEDKNSTLATHYLMQKGLTAKDFYKKPSTEKTIEPFE